MLFKYCYDLSDESSNFIVQKRDSYPQGLFNEIDEKHKNDQYDHANLDSDCDKEGFRCTLLQKAAKSGCINKTKYVINKIMDAREKHQKNLYFCKYTIFEKI